MLVWDIFYYPFPFVVGRNGDVNLLTVATFRTIKQCQGALCDDAGLDTNIAQYAFGYNIVCLRPHAPKGHGFVWCLVCQAY